MGSKEHKDFLVFFGELGARIFKDPEIIKKYKDHPNALLNPEVPEGVSPAYWVLTEDRKIDAIGTAGRIQMAEKIKKAQDDASFFREIESYSSERQKQIAILEEIFRDGKYGLALSDAIAKLDELTEKERLLKLELHLKAHESGLKIKDVLAKLNKARIVDFILSVLVSVFLSYLLIKGF